MRTHSPFLILLHTLLPLLTACTAPPSRELAAYREAFAHARNAGEQVALDLGLATERAADLHERQASSSFTPPSPLSPVPDPDLTPADHAAVRLRAWELIARYNELLTRLAEGRAQDDLDAATDGLLASLDRFPWEAIGTRAADLAGSLNPAASLARDLLIEARRERDRRRLLVALDAGAPLIDAFIDLLALDAADCRTLHTALHDRETAAALADAAASLRSLRALLERAPTGTASPAGEPDPTAGSRAAALAALRTFPEYRDRPAEQLIPEPRAPLPPEAAARAAELAGAIRAGADRVRAADQRLDAHDRLLTEHARTLAHLRRSLAGLRRAASDPASAPGFPATEDLVLTAARLRLALHRLQNTR